ncbi:MAG: glycosyltransferase family 2 protein [Terrimicrobiaceae bacterium]
MSAEGAKIVGIVLVRNEDLFVGQAVKNIAGFCDSLILCDHGSTDGTAEILGGLARSLPHAAVHRLAHPSGSHDLLKAFAGTRTWVFGVDGDEIYDPGRLQNFRPRLLAGEFDRVWRMKGNVLHCTALARDRSSATGHPAPPSRSITKLYNFGAIVSWDGDTVERLHGGTIRFQPGFDDSMKKNFQEETGWEESPLRCLHTCFLPRSTHDASRGGVAVRRNIMEIYRGGIAGTVRRFACRLLRRPDSQWKKDFYRRGPQETVDARAFFS